MVEKRIFTLLFRVGFTHKQNVSFSPTVRNYIRNQEEHHRIKPFSEEYDSFIEKYEFSEQLG
jgi:hypothetical protein